MEQQTQDLFRFLLQSLEKITASGPSAHLLIAFASFALSSAYSSLTEQYSIQTTSYASLAAVKSRVRDDLQRFFSSQVTQWVTSALDIQSALSQSIRSINWSMRDHRIAFSRSVFSRMVRVDQWLEGILAERRRGAG